MKLLICLLFFVSFNNFSYENQLSGKSLICAYGKNKNVYEAYLFFNKNFVSKFLFLEKKIVLKLEKMRNEAIL